MTTTTLEEIKEWKRKAELWDSMKNRDTTLAEDLITKLPAWLDQIKLELVSIGKRLDPSRTIPSGKRSANRANYEEVTRELYKKLEEGTHLTMEDIRSRYSDLRDMQLYRIIKTLSKMPGVESVKEGRKTRLFHHQGGT